MMRHLWMAVMVILSACTLSSVTQTPIRSARLLANPTDTLVALSTGNEA